MAGFTKLADFAQKTISFGLFGLTVYLLIASGRGAYVMSQKRKERLALLAKEQPPETSGSAQEMENTPTVSG